MAEHVASLMFCTNSVNSALAPSLSNQSPSSTASKTIPASQHEQEVSDWTTLKDVGNLRVNDDQAEKAARRMSVMSVYPIKGGLCDKDAPTTPVKSPFELGAHLREFISATPGAAANMLPKSRLGDL